MNKYNYEYIKMFKQICTLYPTELMDFLNAFLKNYYNNIIRKDENYLLAEGDIPIALCAHLDTVGDRPPNNIFYDPEENVLWSPDLLGADDRAGIFAIMIIIASGYRPTIIFTDQEEIGGIGAKALVSDYPKGVFGKFKSIIELDRRGSLDAVYYYHNDPKFENYINSFGFKTNYGTFSDISIIAPAWGCAAVNLSIGYYNEHSLQEYLKLDELFITIKKVEHILDNINDMPYFDYKPFSAVNSFSSFRPSYGDKCGICNRFFGKKEKIYEAYGLSVCKKCFNEYCS